MAVSAHASGTETTIVPGTFTVTIATPAVFTKTGHGLAVGDAVVLSTTGALPTGLTAGTVYWVTTVVDANTFRVSTTPGGSEVATSGSQSGTHTAVTEQLLTDANVAATFQPVLDKVNFAAGDIFEVRMYQRVLTGGIARCVYPVRFEGAQPYDDLIATCVPVNNDLAESGAVLLTLRQVAGSSRSVPWKLLKFV